jgi:hypothetical protein
MSQATEQHKGLTVNVYRNARWAREGADCTNKGASSQVEEFTVVGVVRQKRGKTVEPMPRGSQVFTPDEKAPAAVLVQSQLDGAPPHLVPLDVHESGRWSMDGGNLVDSSDSRWTEVVSSFLPGRLHVSAVSIHDRVETAEQSRALSI